MSEKNILRKIYYNRGKLRNAIEKQYPNAKIRYYEMQISDLIDKLQDLRQSEQGKINLINKYTNYEKIKGCHYEAETETELTTENETEPEITTENYDSESSNETTDQSQQTSSDQIGQFLKNQQTSQIPNFPKNTKINKSRIKR
jgi:hypothetical protein